MCHSAQVSCRCDIRTPTRGRHFVTETLARCYGLGVLSAMTMGDVELVATELLTNAAKVGTHDVLLELALHRHWVYVAVTDDGHGAPHLQVARPTDEHGRGLAIVASIATRWGMEPAGSRKIVWARVPIDVDLPAVFACRTPDQS